MTTGKAPLLVNLNAVNPSLKLAMRAC